METRTDEVVAAVVATHGLAMAAVSLALCAVILTDRDSPPGETLYRPVVEVVSTREFPPRLSFTNQFPRMLVVPVADALIGSGRPSGIVVFSGEIGTLIASLADAVAHNAKQRPMAQRRDGDAFFMPPIFGDADRNQCSRRTSQKYIDFLTSSECGLKAISD